MAKFVHGIWNTGEQKVRFKQDKEGVCPCCNSEYETTTHIFQCLALEMIAHRTTQLMQLQEFLAQQEISKSVKECIYAGITGWIQSQVEKPTLHAPTRGKLMPADQLARAAFVDQTALGWDAFCRGQISQY